MSKQIMSYESYSGATYPWVPKTRVETCPPILSGPSFANPKSETLAWNFLSKRMLLLLKSLWITGGLTCSWRYSKPLAASSAILNRVSQSRLTDMTLESTRKQFIKINSNITNNKYWTKNSTIFKGCKHNLSAFYYLLLLLTG